MGIKRIDKEWKNWLKKSIKKRECCICGCKRNLTLHHKIPLEMGGLDDLNNVIFLCRKHYKEFHEPVDKHNKMNPTARWYLKRIGMLRKKYRKNE